MSDIKDEKYINNNKSSGQLRNFKFMANIVQGAMHQTRYMKALEKITLDAQVAYTRLFMALGAGGIITLIYVNMIFSGSKFKFIALPATLMYIAFLIIIVNFLISSRIKSMVISAGKLAFFPFIERSRRKLKKLGDLKTFGIESFSGGVIHFTNGDYGVIYKIDGVLGLSALPTTANAVADAKAGYLVGRPASSQEYMIISVVENDTRSQQINLGNFYKNVNPNDLGGLWIRAMAVKTQDIIRTRIDGEYTVIEHVILRDTSLESLKKTVLNFENAVIGSGLYAGYDRLKDINEVIIALSPLAMLSKKGQVKNGRTK